LGGRDSLVGVGGLGTTTGFFFTTTTGFWDVDSSVDFIVMIFVWTGDSDMFVLIRGAVERGSPRRLSRTDFSAYSLI
jgi:hypothetical protein